MQRLVMGFDFETTGFDNKKDRIIEVGAVVWDWERKAPLQMLSQICWQDSIPPKLSQEIQDVTGIIDSDIQQFGTATSHALEQLMLMSMGCEAVFAHNFPFDDGFLMAECERLGMKYQLRGTKVDTVTDCPYNHIKHKSKSLTHLCATHGFLNPFAHRAVTDALAMMTVASNYDLDVILERAQSPNVTMVARVSFEQKDKAKAAGFHWQPESKEWTRKMKEIDLKPDMGFDFKVDIQQELPI